MLLSPSRLSVLMTSSSLWLQASAAIGAITYLVAGALLGADFSHADVLATVGAMIVTMIGFTGLGLVAGAVVIVIKRGNPVGWLIRGASVVLGGVFYPTEILPAGPPGARPAPADDPRAGDPARLDLPGSRDQRTCCPSFVGPASRRASSTTAWACSPARPRSATRGPTAAWPSTEPRPMRQLDDLDPRDAGASASAPGRPLDPAPADALASLVGGGLDWDRLWDLGAPPRRPAAAGREPGSSHPAAAAGRSTVPADWLERATRRRHVHALKQRPDGRGARGRAGRARERRRPGDAGQGAGRWPSAVRQPRLARRGRPRRAGPPGRPRRPAAGSWSTSATAQRPEPTFTALVHEFHDPPWYVGDGQRGRSASSSTATCGPTASSGPTPTGCGRARSRARCSAGRPGCCR